jgi:hypothetical protein
MGLRLYAEVRNIGSQNVDFIWPLFDIPPQGFGAHCRLSDGPVALGVVRIGFGCGSANSSPIL